MAASDSIDLRNDFCDARAARYANGSVEARTGTRPANTGIAATGSLLVTWALDGTPMGAASGGVISFADTPMPATASGSGNVGYIRIYDSLGNAVTDLTVTATGGGGDVTMPSVAVAATEIVNLASISFTQP